jgi:Arc/MetJ-type ribon-helix-helix transcriptional regulator
MPYPLPPDVSERLQACIASGNYKSEDEVLREALSALEQRDRDKLRRWQEGNEIAMEQSRQNLSRPLNDDVVLARLRERLAAEGISD